MKTNGLERQSTAGAKGVAEYRRFFSEVWPEGMPLFHLFKTESHGYAYDTGTNKMLRCEGKEYEFLEHLKTAKRPDRAIDSFIEENGEEAFVETADKIRTAIESERVFQAKRVKGFGMGPHFQGMDSFIDNGLWVLLLEVTEICNLRCAYCTYGDHYEGMRGHGTRQMPQPVAFAAIDYLKEHSGGRKDVAITFYGGEPLVQFPLIKECVAYAKEIMEDREIDFFMTTNGTLITPEIAAFLAEHRFCVSVSIDGPKEIHDANRKDVGGRGSFDRALRGLRYVVDAYGPEATKKKVRLSMVYAPPYTANKVDRIAELWKENPWMPKDMECRLSYPGPNSINPKKYKPEELQEHQNLWDWVQQDYRQKKLNDERAHPFTKANLETALAAFVQRPIFNEPLEKFWLNGCCVPGGRKLYVTVDGLFRICERISDKAPALGDVFLGMDKDVIKDHYVGAFEKTSLSACSKCWNRRLCGMCYIKATGPDGQWDPATKWAACQSEMKTKDSVMRLYAEILEKAPERLDYLNDYELE